MKYKDKSELEQKMNEIKDIQKEQSRLLKEENLAILKQINEKETKTFDEIKQINEAIKKQMLHKDFSQEAAYEPDDWLDYLAQSSSFTIDKEKKKKAKVAEKKVKWVRVFQEKEAKKITEKQKILKHLLKQEYTQEAKYVPEETVEQKKPTKKTAPPKKNMKELLQ